MKSRGSLVVVAYGLGSYEFFKTQVQNYNWNLPRKQFNGAYKTPYSHRIRVGTPCQALLFLADLKVLNRLNSSLQFKMENICFKHFYIFVVGNFLYQ